MILYMYYGTGTMYECRATLYIHVYIEHNAAVGAWAFLPVL